MTGKEIFDLAIICMGENDDTDGNTDTPDTLEYKVRAPGIINILIGECYRYSDTYEETEDGTRPVPNRITDLDGWVDLDDYLCATVLPYGLAAELLKTEDAATAGYCLQRYTELLNEAKNNPGTFDAITDVYGIGTEYNEFARW